MSDSEDDYCSSDDADYVPSDGEAVSEEEGSGDDENLDAGDKADPKKGKKRKKDDKMFSRKRHGGIKLDDPEPEQTETLEEDVKDLATEMKEEEKVHQEEKEKKRADDLWADFMKDVGHKPKPKPTPTPTPTQSSTLKSPAASSSEVKKKEPVTSSAGAQKITIVKEYDFAGETVKVTKEVDACSKEAKAELKKKEAEAEKQNSNPSSSLTGLANLKRPGRGGGGLGSVLGKIGKKDKISTLNKSKLDWDKFKEEEGIKADLQAHNKGKQGYIERQAFLNRTDQRVYELERDTRLSKR
ncbi:unnamed protein product [Owenia fusiformis]|uniref:Uncharacterized protein n=1 Tax=Owenia fusiformis TaxID=6347 RepID=A0A8J1UQR2_OWEFU|nr:unnamed protein product [Owenia fusiformis]